MQSRPHNSPDWEVSKLELVPATAQAEIKPNWNRCARIKLPFTRIEIVKMWTGATWEIEKTSELYNF